MLEPHFIAGIAAAAGDRRLDRRRIAGDNSKQ